MSHQSQPIGGMQRANVEAPQCRRDVKTIALDEAKKFAVIFVYLFIVFGIFVLHEWAVLSSKQINYQFYGVALVNALILAKIILVAEDFHFAERFKARPLVYPIAYKSLAFTILLLIAYLAEAVLVGMLHGKTLAQSLPDIGGGTVGGFLSIAIIMFFALMPFFTFREISRAIGADLFRALMFTAK